MRVLTKTDQYAQNTLDELNVLATEDLELHTNIWVGNLTDLITQVNEKAHVGHVSKLLQASGAITLLRAGSGGRGSEIQVNRRRIYEDDKGNPIPFDPDQLSNTPTQQLSAKLNALNGRVQVLEGQMAIILQDYHQRQREEFADGAMASFGPNPLDKLEEGRRNHDDTA